MHSEKTKICNKIWGNASSLSLFRLFMLSLAKINSRFLVDYMTSTFYNMDGLQNIIIHR